MYLDKNSETKWLIKSESRILGPYNLDQIIDLIRKKQISLIDEVRDAETRWLYVRENPEFKSIVEEMRNELNSRVDNTVTLQSSSKANHDDQLQKTKTDFNQFTDISLEAKDIVIVNETLSTPVISKSDLQLKAGFKQLKKSKDYGIHNDKAVKDKLSFYFKKAVIALIVIVVMLGSAFYGYIYIQKRNSIKQEEEIIVQIRKYKFLGLDQKVVELFPRITVANQKKLIPELLEIYPSLELAGLLDGEDLKSIKSNLNLPPEQKAIHELVYFWLSIQKKDYGTAQDYLVRATTFQPSALIIKENEAFLSNKIGKHINAFNLFKNIFSQEKNGRYLLGMVEAYNGLSESERALYGKELLSALDGYTKVYYDYKKELLMAQIVIAFELNDKVLYKDSITQFFNTPCRLSNQFIKPGLSIFDYNIWSEYKDTGKLIQNNMNEDEKILFQLHFFIESNLMSDAADFLSTNIAKINNEAVRTQMTLLLLDAQNRNAEVVALEKLQLLDMDSELNHLIIAQNKVELESSINISTHLQFLDKKKNYFYKDWLELAKLIKENSTAELKTYIRDHFITNQNFKPVFIAKGLVN